MMQKVLAMGNLMGSPVLASVTCFISVFYSSIYSSLHLSMKHPAYHSTGKIVRLNQRRFFVLDVPALNQFD